MHVLQAKTRVKLIFFENLAKFWELQVSNKLGGGGGGGGGEQCKHRKHSSSKTVLTNAAMREKEGRTLPVLIKRCDVICFTTSQCSEYRLESVPELHTPALTPSSVGGLVFHAASQISFPKLFWSCFMMRASVCAANTRLLLC